MKGSETSNNSNETNHTASDLDAIARRKMAGALNGWSKGETVKGSAATNGHSPNQPQLSMYFGHDRAEVSRLLIQALGDLGHSSLATSLAEESGVELEKPAVAEFREAIMQGNWTLAESYLSNRPSSPVSNGDSPKEEKDVLEFLESTTPLQVLFWIRQQKFLELLEAQDFGRATMVLRREIIDLIRGDTEKIHVLTNLIFCPSVAELKIKAHWDGARGKSRALLLGDISKCFAPSVMVRPHRLATLLSQAKRAQIASCSYHNTDVEVSLLCDHTCGKEIFPPVLVKELKHTGEVWSLQFSHDGTRLATCSSDGKLIIWDVETLEPIRTLTVVDDESWDGDDVGVTAAAWSPDDHLIITCSMDKRVRLWNAKTGKLKRTLPESNARVSCCAWTSDGKRFLTGSLSRVGGLQLWELNSKSNKSLTDFGCVHRIQDLVVAPNDRFVVAIDNRRHLFVYDLESSHLEYEIQLKADVTTLSISEDSAYVLLGDKDGIQHLFAVESNEEVRTYTGLPTDKIIIRNAFGGRHDHFVASGSERGLVFIWQKDAGNLVGQFDAHGPGACNSLAWNRVNNAMFATGGDDNTAKVWSIAQRPINIGCIKLE